MTTMKMFSRGLAAWAAVAGSAALAATVENDSLAASFAENDVGKGRVLQNVAKKPVDVMCVYYPHWHRYQKGDEWFGAENWKQGEWAYVKTAKPRFVGHNQPLVPYGGFRDESDPEQMAVDIALAANAGIDVFLYDYYYYNGQVTQEDALEKGFLGAANRNRMKFALMWCYHERNNQFRVKSGEPRVPLMSLAHTPEEFLGLIDLSVARYFHRPEYYRKDGRLFFSVYNAPYFLERVGTNEVKAAIAEARRRVRAAGLGELHLNAQNARAAQSAVLKDVGFDSLTHYGNSPWGVDGFRRKFVQEKERIFDYSWVVEGARRTWEEMRTAELPYIPSVLTGWDSTPRCRDDEPFPWKNCDYPYSYTLTNNTPDAVQAHLAAAKAYAEGDPRQPGIVYVNGWNEYTEGSFLIPNNFTADGLLRAVAAVFGRQPADEYTYINPSSGKLLTVPAATHENVAYGSHARQKIDLWLPPSAAGKVPLLVYVHGGGWGGGAMCDGIIGPEIGTLLDRGVAVACVGYRYLRETGLGPGIPPVKGCVDDVAAAIRFLKSRSDAWGIDVSRIGLAGGSAGACTALILAYRNGNDLGIRALAPIVPQTSMDPAEMREWIPNSTYGAQAFGYRSFNDWLAHRDEHPEWIAAYSPAALARRIDSAKAPHVILRAPQPKSGELPKDPTHAAAFSWRFAEICRARGLPCDIQERGDALLALAQCLCAGAADARADDATAELGKFRQLADRRIAAIRETASIPVPASAPCYYVSAKSGDDAADGRTPATAWRTAARLEAEKIAPGSFVLFERGGLYRGTVVTSAGVTYTAYGKGPKPVIYGSPENGADPAKWTQTENPCVWAYDIGHEDVGTLVFDEGRQHAIKHVVYTDKETGKKVSMYTGRPFGSYRDLDTDLHFWHDYSKDGTGKVYLYSRENPGTRFKSIEFNVRRRGFAVGGAPGVTIDNFTVKYLGWHGVGALECKDLTVSNCEFGWIGGSIQSENFRGRGTPVRFGNAVEIYGGCDNYTVTNCYVYQVYDAGLTQQYGVKENDRTSHDQRNVRYADNVIEKCNYSIEYFLSTKAAPDNPSRIENFVIEDNLMFDAGVGFCEQRPDREEAAHIKSWAAQSRNRATGYVVRRNAMCRSNVMLVQIYCSLKNEDGSSTMPVVTDNVFIGRAGQRFGLISETSRDCETYANGTQAYVDKFGSGNRCLILPARRTVDVRLEDMPGNPFGAPVRVEGVGDASCLKYEASTKRAEKPYDAAKPWAYWWWLNGNVSEESIARDLDELASAGFGGIVHVDPRGYWDDAEHTVLPKSAMPVGGGRWTDLVAFSIRECAKRRLGFVCLDSSDAGELKDAASRRVDVRDPAAVRRHLDTWLGPLVARVGDLAGTTWVGVTTASWEGDVAGWDPAEAGRIAADFYGTERAWLGARGLELWGQLGGPWDRRVPFFAAADQLKFYSFADVPEGEFWSKWFGDNHGGSYHVRGVVSAAHLYGRPIAQAEAFTHMTRHWSKDPAQLKRAAVEAFADGVNRLVFHEWTCRDEAWGLPGNEYFAGTHFNGATTWSAHLKDFVAFVTRCQRLLQLGEPVVDIAICAGPHPYQGGIGQGRLRYDPFGDGRVTVPRGYAYDVVNDDFLAGRAKGCGYACVVRAEGTNRVDVAKAAKLPLPDCEGDVTFAHRRTADSDIYFVAGEGPQTLTFRVKGRHAALYDPVSGDERPLRTRETSDGRTRVAVELPVRDGCAFVIFRDPVEVKGPWQVTFRPATGRPPFARTFAALADWNESDDPDVRFFAGTATYRATVTVPSGARIAALAFGELGSGLATVRVNGVAAQGGRAVWCAPWRADCRGLFRDGENTIEIDVTNNWMNRLIGDAALPPEKRTTKSNLRLEPDGAGAFNDFSGYRAGDRLQPCGLRGPVELLAGGVETR